MCVFVFSICSPCVFMQGRMFTNVIIARTERGHIRRTQRGANQLKQQQQILYRDQTTKSGWEGVKWLGISAICLEIWAELVYVFDSQHISHVYTNTHTHTHTNTHSVWIRAVKHWWVFASGNPQSPNNHVPMCRRLCVIFHKQYAQTRVQHATSDDNHIFHVSDTYVCAICVLHLRQP